MQEEKYFITPQTRVAKLLDEYPQLENELIILVSAFKKLKNPILRRTVAKVTSLQQAAIVGQVKVDFLVNRLREIVGQDKLENWESTQKFSSAVPEWFDKKKIKKSLDARPILERGDSPLTFVLAEIKALGKEDIYELISPFLPAPLIDKVKAKGFDYWTYEESADLFKTYFIKK